MLAKAVAAFLAIALAIATGTARADGLELGLVPYLPTEPLLAAHQPLRAFIEKELGQPVRLSTAPDFRAFAGRALLREYDFAVTGSALGRFIQREAGYTPLLVSRRNIRAQILVPEDSPVQSVADLAGVRVATMEPFTAIAQLGNEMLRRAGLDPLRDVVLLPLKSPYNARQSAALGESDAAIVTGNLLPAAPADAGRPLRVLAQSDELPGLMLLVRHRPPLPDARRLRTLLLRFFNETEAGAAMARNLAQDGYREVTQQDLRALDRFGIELKRYLAR